MRVPSCAARRLLLPAAAALGLLALGVLQPPARPRPRPLRLPPTPAAPDEAEEGPAHLLPLEYWAHRAASPSPPAPRDGCAPPARAALERAAPGWQSLAVRGGSLYLYAAHWDAREPAARRVRVLVYCDVAPLPALTCLLWFEDRSAPLAVPATATYGWRPQWGGGPKDTVNEPYVVACPAPPGAPPRALSLAPAPAPPCPAPRNLLAVQGTAPAPRGTSVAACLKWLDYPEDVSGELAEWLALLRALGARAVYTYTRRTHGHVRAVLRAAARRGWVRATPLWLAPRRREPGPAAGLSAYRQELLSLNDCLYRALADGHAWLAVLDMDEMIVPLRDDTWDELIERETRAMRAANESSADAIVFRNYYFLRGAQRERAATPPAHMLADVWRASEPSPPGYYVKSFHNVSSVVAVHNHLPISCGARACHWRYAALEDGRLQHYRSRCAEDAAQCAALHATQRDAALGRVPALAAAPHVARQLLEELHIPIPAAGTDLPGTEVPTTEVPTTEVPTTEVPTTEVPTTEVPTTEVPRPALDNITDVH